MNLTEAREKLAAVLAPIADDDPDVLVSLVDSLEPPALMIGWDDPMLEAPTTACLSTGRLAITVVAGRLVPGEGVSTLEDLIAYTHRRLRADSGAWAIDVTSGPRRFDMAQTTYLAARITVRVTIT
jgi:hypothetical protein